MDTQPNRGHRTALYIGAPGMGKTRLALSHASAREAPPLLVVDSAGVVPWPSRYRTRLEEAVRDLWERNFDAVRWIPRDGKEFCRMLRVVSILGNCSLLVDELAMWTSSMAAPEELEKIIRLHRHLGISLYCTTQYPVDLPARLRNCATEVYAFGQKDDRATAVLAQWGMAPEAVKALTVGQYLEWKSA